MNLKDNQIKDFCKHIAKTKPQLITRFLKSIAPVEKKEADKKEADKKEADKK